MSRERKYRSHLPVLKLIFDFVSIKSVFEYGCGLYSTGFFVSNANKVISVEMQNKNWYKKVKENIISDKLDLHCKLGELDAIEYFKSNNSYYDLVFVDAIARENCIINAIGKSKIMVVHDLSLVRWNERWQNKVIIPNDYQVIVMEIESPPTTVITSNGELFSYLRGFKNSIVGK
jgi:hypothetical protein